VAAGLFALLVGVTGAPAADPPAKDTKGNDRVKLLGKWLAVSGERGGKPMTKEECEAFHILIDEKHLTIAYSDLATSAFRHTFAIDPKADPKTIDLTTVDTRALFDYKGIYVLDGDSLKICIGQIRGKRPTEFATKADGPGYRLYVLKRQK
jgi:uncharacterized protein (TIGR03067 family)